VKETASLQAMSDAPFLAATRDAYDLMAADYADMVRSGLDGKPLARRAYPDLRFELGSMLALDLPDAALDLYRQQPEEVAQLLRGAGFDMWATAVREPDPQEKTPHGYVLARKPD
jgi:hypothetical protein